LPLPIERRFSQVDVFSEDAFQGNPVAVVIDGDGLTTEEMARLARWTNLSETTFLSTPTSPAADYRVRIFTPATELPFAGHPTLGSAHAWLASGGVPSKNGVIVQEGGTGVVTIRHEHDGLAFAAPPVKRSGPLDDSYLAAAIDALGIEHDSITGHQWVDNGTGWAAIALKSAEEVLALKPDFSRFSSAILGVVGAYPEGAAADFEVRAFPIGRGLAEDPVTGSLNAGLAQWLIRTRRSRASYVAAQGSALKRNGLIRIDSDSDGTVWVGGATRTLIAGTVTI
jgi:PhzF family phenazine biosynthesis protein